MPLWLTAKDRREQQARASELEMAALGPLLSRLIMAADETPKDGREKTLAALVALLMALHEIFPTLQRLVVLAVVGMRKLGRTQQSLQLAKDEHARRPSWLSSVTAANALRHEGALEAALDHYQQGLTHEPSQLSTRLDIGDLWLELGEPKKAAQSYQQVVRREPQHPWALPSMLFAQYLDSGNDRIKRELVALAASNPCAQQRLASLP